MEVIKVILSTVNYTNKNSKDFEIFKRNYELQKTKKETILIYRTDFLSIYTNI